MTNDTAADAPPYPPHDIMTATVLAPHDATNAPELRLDDIMAVMRQSFIAGNLSDFELMLGAQATVLNAAFNRMMGCVLTREAVRPAMVEPALRAQRNACTALNTLCRLRAETRSGKRNEEA